MLEHITKVRITRHGDEWGVSVWTDGSIGPTYVTALVDHHTLMVMCREAHIPPEEGMYQLK